jgi:hypothetical protein
MNSPEKIKIKAAGVGYLINRIQTLFVGMLRIWTIPIVLMLSVASGSVYTGKFQCTDNHDGLNRYGNHQSDPWDYEMRHAIKCSQYFPTNKDTFCIYVSSR